MKKLEVGQVQEFANIKWHVLAVNPDRSLLLSKDIVAQRQFHDYSSQWAISDLRKEMEK